MLARQLLHSKDVAAQAEAVQVGGDRCSSEGTLDILLCLGLGSHRKVPLPSLPAIALSPACPSSLQRLAELCISSNQHFVVGMEALRHTLHDRRQFYR